MKSKKTIVAGPLVLEVIYPRGAGGENPTMRAGKRKLTSEAQKRMNIKYSYQKLELMLAANFVPGDLVVTLTYDDEHLPATRARAVADLKEFRRRLKAARARTGRKLRMIWATEDSFGAGRWHHHCVINAAGEDYSVIRHLWTGGSDVDIAKLRIDKDHSYEALARYLCKEARDKPRCRSWSSTRGLQKPQVEICAVDDDAPLQAPRGAHVYEDAASRNEFGSWRYIKYLAPDWRSAKRRRAPRKQRR